MSQTEANQVVLLAIICQDFCDQTEPMVRTTVEAIHGLINAPVFTWFSIRISGRRSNNGYFFGRENGVAKRALYISLLENPFLADCLTGEETQ